MLVSFLSVLALIVFGELLFRQSGQTVVSMQTMNADQAKLQSLLNLLSDAEAGQRGFLLTGEEAYLVPYQQAVRHLPAQLESVREVCVRHHLDLALFASLSRTISHRMSELEVVIALRRKGGEDSQAWRAMVETGIGKRYMDQIRSDMQLVDDAFDRQAQRVRSDIVRNAWVARVATVVSLVCSLLLFFFYIRQRHRTELVLRQQQETLQDQRSVLERMVRERTVRLSELASHLIDVQEIERAALARELHDELGALLTAAKLDLARLKSRLGVGIDEALKERIAHLNQSLNDGVAIKRRIIEHLRPSSLSHFGLTQALVQFCNEFQRRSDIDVSHSLEEVVLSEEAQLAVFRIVQEALTNVVKYARAKTVELTLKSYSRHLELDIKDDGCGFDVEAVGSGKHGLTGMRHRIEALKGSLLIKSSEAGTHIIVRLPVVSVV